jgi:opacity protein-like surface antigen
MKKLHIVQRPPLRVLAAVICAVLTLGLTAASAQVYSPPPTYVVPAYVPYSGNDLGFYFNGDVGPSFMPDFQSSRFGGPPTSFSAHPGVRFDGEPGFNFLAAGPLTLGGEFETGVIYNRLYSINEAGLPISSRGDFYQVPLLGNLMLRIHTDSLVVPYIGIGGGGDASWARVLSPGFGFETRSEVDPAAQAMGGVRFQIAPNVDVGVGYKFLATFPSEGRYFATHAASFTFTFRF